MYNIKSKIVIGVLSALLLVSGVMQGRPQQSGAAKTKSQNGTAAQSSNTPGRIAKFTDSKFVGDSNITEDESGRIGVGTTLPTSQLTVNGVIEMMGAAGGIKFSDGTLQTTAGLATVSRDNTLKGNGTPASPLGVAVPLTLNGSVEFGSVLVVSNTKTSSTGVTANGGPSGAGVRGQGGNGTFGGPGVAGIGGTSTNFLPGGTGVGGLGGDSDTGDGGNGMIGDGGDSISRNGGTGVSGQGGRSVSGNGGRGVRALAGDSGGPGTRGGTGIEAIKGFGVNGGSDGLAGNFLGNFQVIGNTLVTGTLSKGGGSFKIDHPLDPENRYLYHSFVESPDMMNIYNGLVSLGGNGEAVVEMPEWFGALNRDFRYLLTAVGAPMPGLYIAEEITNNRFKISGGVAGMKVSWQVTGVRQDAWANKNRIKVEEDKSETERGHYLHPEAFNKAEERGVEWANQPELMREIQQRRLDAGQARKPQK